MDLLTFAPADSYCLAVLVKGSSFDRAEIERAYIEPLETLGVARESVLVSTLPYSASGKASATFIKAHLATLLPELDALGVKVLYVADAAYFKVLARVAKAEANLGYVMPCRLAPESDHEHRCVVLGVNHKSLIFAPHNSDKLALSLRTLVHASTLTTLPRGQDDPVGLFDGDFFTDASYPHGLSQVRGALRELGTEHPVLAVDIETFSLDVECAGIATIAFAVSDRAGTAFACDWTPGPAPRGKEVAGHPGFAAANNAVRAALRAFFEAYAHAGGTLVFHNAVFDVKMLVRHLWMEGPDDTRGLLRGLDVLTRSWHDTRLMAYLCLNTTGDLDLSLKSLGHGHAGNYAVDEIKDVSKIPEAELLEYNLIDAATTMHLYERFDSVLVAEAQAGLYEALFMPSQRVIVQMELTGMPLDPDSVAQARTTLETIMATHQGVIDAAPQVARVSELVTYREWSKDFETRRAKAKSPDKISPKDRNTYPEVGFKANSTAHLQVLLHDVMGLPVLERTQTGQPAVGADVLEMLVHHVQDPADAALLDALVGLSKAAKILSTFVSAFEKGSSRPDGRDYLMGSFMMGGTVSGRLSSARPNMQNLPSGSTYGTLVKGCFRPPPGWLMVGADFNSLEDYISALTTRDPARMNVYLQGFDGHCLRAFAYFGDRMPDIVDTVESINSIKTTYPKLRQLSKTPTFLLLYGGTAFGLMKQCGFTESEARTLETRYHELYKVSDAWVQDRLDQAARDGYITTAFGLKLRTPILARSTKGERTTPRERASEARTAGNALGQAYGLLTNRSMNAFMARVHDSAYRLDIKPIAMIHDASYFLVRENPEVLEFVNTHLIEAMQWQEAEELVHDTVKLGAELDVFHPSWAEPITIPNRATASQILALCRRAVSTRAAA